jgi:hypothetical protein
MAIGGLALMSMREAAILGFIIAVLAAAGILSLYWRDYLKARRARAVPASDVLELAFPPVFALVVVIIGLLVWPRDQIEIEKFAVFWVQISKNNYQIGIVAQLWNRGTWNYEIKGLSFDSMTSWTLVPRGGYLWRRYEQSPDHIEFVENNDLPAGGKQTIPKLLDMKFDFSVVGGVMPDFIIAGQWKLLSDRGDVFIEPRCYLTYENPVSVEEWNQIDRPNSKIRLDNLHCKPFLSLLPTQG